MDKSKKKIQQKKLYEIILTNEIDLEVKKQSILSIIQMALTDHSIFQFLLSKINWFCQTNVLLIPLLAKVVRAYRGTSKTAPKVVYNLLCEGLSISHINISVVDILTEIISTQQNTQMLIECLKQNYPHKACTILTHIAYVQSLLELSKKAPLYRLAIMQIIIQNLCQLDTEMSLGDNYIQKMVYEDEDIKDLIEECGELQQKYDEILSRVIKYIEQYDENNKRVILKELFFIFQSVILIVEKTKFIQCLVFYVVQGNQEFSQMFIGLLFIFVKECYGNFGKKKIYVAALQYLRSYLNKSKIIQQKTITKILNILLIQLKEGIKNMEQEQFQKININNFGQQNIFNLYLLETIFYINWKFCIGGFSNKNYQQFQEIVALAKIKLHYHAFIDPMLLQVIGDEKHQQCCMMTSYKKQGFTTKFVQKFLPVFLPETSKYVKMRQSVSHKRKRPHWWDQSTQYDGGNCIFKKLSGQFSTNGNISRNINGQKLDV